MKRRLKLKPIIILVITVIALIVGIIYLVKTINYHKTYESNYYQIDRVYN